MTYPYVSYPQPTALLESLRPPPLQKGIIKVLYPHPRPLLGRLNSHFPFPPPLPLPTSTFLHLCFYHPQTPASPRLHHLDRGSFLLNIPSCTHLSLDVAANQGLTPIVMASHGTVHPDTPIRTKVTFNGSTRRFKFNLRDLGANVLLGKVCPSPCLLASCFYAAGLGRLSDEKRMANNRS